MVVIYLDLVFLLNCVADALALYVTARLSGVPVHRYRVMIASLLGGLYGVACLIISGEGFVPQVMVAATLIWIVFGLRAIFVRLLILFFVLSCSIGGVMIALTQALTQYGISNTLQNMNWKVFLLAGGICYFLLSVVFRGSASHSVSGQICKGVVWRNGKKTPLNILIDTGHTLCDPVTGTPVMTVWLDALRNILSAEEWKILSQLGFGREVQCCERLSDISPGVFRLIPYRAVGVSNGMLLCFLAESVTVNHRNLGQITIAISTTSLSDGGSCNALWGGDRNMMRQDDKNLMGKEELKV